jgi:hypothetical protein
VPVIVLFTKYDQFRIDIAIMSEDPYCNSALLDAEVERIFNQDYLARLAGPPLFAPPPFIRLESEDLHYYPSNHVLY